MVLTVRYEMISLGKCLYFCTLNLPLPVVKADRLQSLQMGAHGQGTTNITGSMVHNLRSKSKALQLWGQL